jgi:hypothetical protein
VSADRGVGRPGFLVRLYVIVLINLINLIKRATVIQELRGETPFVYFVDTTPQNQSIMRGQLFLGLQTITMYRYRGGVNWEEMNPLQVNPRYQEGKTRSSDKCFTLALYTNSVH